MNAVPAQPGRSDDSGLSDYLNRCQFWVEVQLEKIYHSVRDDKGIMAVIPSAQRGIFPDGVRGKAKR